MITDIKKSMTLILFYSRQAWEYKANSLAELLHLVITVSLLLYFWSLVGDTSSVSSDAERLTYFVLSVSVINLTTGRNLAYASQLSKYIKTGSLGSALLLPFDLFRHAYAQAWGEKIVQRLVSLVAVLVGLVYISNSIAHAGQMALMLVVMLFVGFYFSRLLASIVFITTESDGLRMGVSFTLRIVAGSFVPLVLIPGFWRALLEYSPFSYLAYWVPAMASGVEVNYLQVLLIGVAWAVALAWLSARVFKAALARAEVVGL